MNLDETRPKQPEVKVGWDEMDDSTRIAALLDLVARLAVVTEQLVEASAALEDRVKTLELS